MTNPPAAGSRVSFVRVALHLPTLSAATRLVEEHLSVDLDSTETGRWRPLADVLHSERPDSVEGAVSRARWELRRHPGCRVTAVRTADGAVVAATAARTLHLVATPGFARVVGSLLHTWLASGLAIPPELALSAEPAGGGRDGVDGAGDGRTAEGRGLAARGSGGLAGGDRGGAAQLVSLRWDDPPGRAAIRSATRSMSGPGIDS
ncbi:hypothetical protein [Kitasatospora sp. HPMI-4]|uniref:hypothetical protein n=1 Tax=Kitasatospora sp. HPMI-4 TaxID=3448443 RepID=UPI003F1C9E9E